MNVSLVLAKRVSAKNGKPYTALYFDLGYTLIAVSFDRAHIAELLGMPVRSYVDLCDSLEVDKAFEVGKAEITV